MDKIVLLGYMGAGKSSLGRVLAEKWSLKHYDLDKIIEEKEQKAIPEIFRERGEIYFRKTESRILREFIDKEESFILSLGGGTPCYANNHEILKRPEIYSVYLKTSSEVLMQRLREEKHNRPLISELSDSELLEYINKHLFDRAYYYHQAQYTLQTDHKTIKELSEELLRQIGKE